MRQDSRQQQAASRQQIENRKSKIENQSRPGTLPGIALIFVLLVAYLLVTFAPKPPPKPDATWTRILQEGVFRVGIDPSFPPFEVDDGKGNLSGLDIALADELVREWARANDVGVRVQYVYTGFDGLYDALKAGQFDAIISALPYDPQKTEDVRFSHSYFDGGPLIVVRESDATTKTWYDLAGKRVGVELGSSGDSFARRWQRRLNYDLRQYNTPTDALRALRAGQVDGVFTDLIAFNDFARTESDVKTVGKPLVSEPIVIAVRKDTPTLLQQINAAIDAMKRDGRMERLWAQWLVGSGQ